VSWATAGSKIFSAYITDVLNNTTAIDLIDDAIIGVPLYNNTTAPDPLVSAANSAYAVNQWIVGNEVIDTTTGTSWPTKGRPLATRTITDNTVSVFKFDAADTVSADATADIAAAYGCLLFDDTIATPVADQGISFHYFGGSQGVVNGTFTVVWNTSGIFTITTT
jgi:hypothetical protein